MRYLIPLLLLIGVVIVALWFSRKPRPPALTRQKSAARDLTLNAQRLRHCADQIGAPHAEVFSAMADHLDRIRAEIEYSERNLDQARRFIGHHTPLIVSLVERFVALQAKSGPDQADRLAKMGAQIHGYRDVFARVETALIENDFAEIETTIAALDAQLSRLDP